MHPEAESQFRRYQHTPVLRGTIYAFRLASRMLPLWFMKASAVFIIPVFIIFNAGNFRAVMKNLSHIRPADSAVQRMVASCMVFLYYSFYLIDLFYLSHDNRRIKDYRIKINGEECLQEALSMKQGFIFLTLHMGNWEVAGAVISAKGVKPHIVYSPDSEGTIESQRTVLRGLFNMNDIPLGRVEFFSLRLLNMLRNGEAVAFQGDRLFGESGIEMDFFGGPALFPRGPVVLSMVSEAPIVPVFTVMRGYNRYELFVEKPYRINLLSSREETIRNSLKDVVGIFEKYISLYPEQWYTFMPFWADDRKGTEP